MSRQVLAEPEAGLAEKTWARLADGTPLVTAERRGKGLIVLFHVTADTTWSNLPLSGLFVDMLRRIVAEADAPGRGRRESEGRRARRAPAALAHARRLRRARAAARASRADRRRFLRRRRRAASAGLLRPPESLRAVNALAPGETLARADYGPLAVHEARWRSRRRSILRRWLLPAAFVGLLIDALVSIWLGRRRLAPRARSPPLPSSARSARCASRTSARAGERAPVRDRDMDAALTTRLAYVVTGDAAVDETSSSASTALTRVLAARTSAELAEPVGVDPARDELASIR